MRHTYTILDEIMENKELEVVAAKAKLSFVLLRDKVKERQTEVRDFKKAVSTPNKLHVIAEIKKASPSAGVISESFDHEEVAKEYEQSKKVDAISVITESEFFQGKLDFVKEVKKVTTMPIFRKDFIFDEYQIYESYLAEADALLLIAAVLEEDELRKLIKLSNDLGMAAMVEVHDKAEVEFALRSGATIIGINARDLHTFEINKNLFTELSPLIPNTIIKVAESGIETKADVQQVFKAGANAVLVGTSLMQASNKRKKIEELFSV